MNDEITLTAIAPELKVRYKFCTASWLTMHRRFRMCWLQRWACLRECVGHKRSIWAYEQPLWSNFNAGWRATLPLPAFLLSQTAQSVGAPALSKTALWEGELKSNTASTNVANVLVSSKCINGLSCLVKHTRTYKKKICNACHEKEQINSFFQTWSIELRFYARST